MIERVVLHVGLEKTGSTSLQEGLARLEDRLAGYGIKLSAAGRRRPEAARNLLPWRDLDHEDWDVLRRELRRPTPDFHTLVVSNQALWRQRDAVLGRLQRFIDGRTTQAIMYVRDPAALLQSMTLQQVKSARRAFDFDDREQFDAFAARRLPDYLDIARRYQQVVGAELEARVYDTDALVGGGVVSDFLSVLLPAIELADPPEPRANPSLSADVARVLHTPEVQSLDAPAGDVLDVALRISAEPGRPRFFLDEATARHLRDATVASTRSCLQRYQRSGGELRDTVAWATEPLTEPISGEELARRIENELAWGPNLTRGWHSRHEPAAGLFAAGWRLITDDGFTRARMDGNWSSLRLRTDFQRERSVNGPLALHLTVDSTDAAPVRVSVNGEPVATVDLRTDTIPLPDTTTGNGRWEVGLEAPPGPRNIEIVAAEVTQGAPAPVYF